MGNCTARDSTSDCCLRREGYGGGGVSLADLASADTDDAQYIVARLAARGMTPSVASEKRQLFRSAARRLITEGVEASSSARVFWVPGRIEVAGKHTDYAGGRSLLAAVNRGFAVVSVDRDDDVCRIFTTFGTKGRCDGLGPLEQASRELLRASEDAKPVRQMPRLKSANSPSQMNDPPMRQESVELQISKDLQPQQGHWSAYPAVAIRRLARNFDIKLGVDVALECDLPKASGMSSSSAVICYMWLVLSERNNIRASPLFKSELSTPEELYSYLGFIENGQNCGEVLVGDKGVGTFGGSEDHTAIMSCEPGRLNMFSYCPTQHEATFDFPDNLTFVIAVSGALAEKTGDAMADYNNAAFLARDAAACWCDGMYGLPLNGETFVSDRANLAEVVRHVSAKMNADGPIDEVKTAISRMIAKGDNGLKYGPRGSESAVRYRPGALCERFEQFFEESEKLVPELGKAIARSDYASIGTFSDTSHELTVKNLRNTIPETAWLPQEARRQGALGASAFGAGFGGSCWALVERQRADAFAKSWRAAYVARFSRWKDSCEFFLTDPGPGAFSIP